MARNIAKNKQEKESFPKVELINEEQLRSLMGLGYKMFKRYLNEGVIPKPMTFGIRKKWRKEIVIQFLKTWGME